MSRRKVKGLTRTGRQVSEDPDLDNLLSTLSPEEVEELQIDLSKVPDINPEDDTVLVQGESQTRDPKRGNRKESDSKGRLSQREQSLEQTDSKESRTQEYLKKTGSNQEGNSDRRSSLRRQTSVQSESNASRLDDRNNQRAESLKEDRSHLLGRSRLQESHHSEVNEKESLSDNRLQRNRESTGSKAKDMISKLQEKKDDKEKDKREDFRRRDDSKTKDIISKLKEKSEKDVAKDRERRSENYRSQGLVSKMLEKQNKILENQESKTEERKTKTDEKKTEERKRSDVKLERPVSEKSDVVVKQAEDLVNHSDHVKEKDKSATEKNTEKADEKNGDLKGKAKSEEAKTNKTDEKIVNCLSKDNQKSKMKEEDEDEDSSMFDELMEQVRTNDHTLIELNVNNSEVIKTKTLIEFAEALKNNTHVKTFALANCRADDHVAYAIAGMLRNNKTITSLNVDSNLLTGKGILSLIQALQYNSTLTELRFQNQRHICGGKTEMEMVKILKENTTLLKLGYHFELAGPRMTTTNILSRNMDRQRQKRLQEQKQAQANGEKKDTLDVPKTGSGSLRNSPKASPKPSPMQSPMPSPKLTSKRGTVGGLTPPPPPPPPGGAPPPPPPPMLDIDLLKNSLTPVSQRKVDGKGPGGSKNSRDQLLASIRTSNINQLKKVPVPKWLQ
ncbi:leiomodin-1 isoform X1 [Periophthalmus magnuspinnatus]|uniref:leiomodin-1 isoform X1 n=1 Tax=Periophthalmus magnuspinnatus TaxID=409849 RepID=UPI00145A276E|nr:leiomodin-1 isoform X1 [Periophthalmus magnuspinnatus]